jgi:hypothetical protein
MVVRLFAPQFLVVWAFIGSALAVHFRGKVRLGFWRQARLYKGGQSEACPPSNITRAGGGHGANAP